jgi:2-dehydropantoate 2-reductase
MKICIYGAGAIGCWMGVKLAQAGHTVSVLARGASLEAIAQNGLRLTQDGSTASVSVIASDDAHLLGPQDLVIVSVKAPAMRAVAQGIAPLLDASTVILTAMNGVPWWFCSGLAKNITSTRLESVDPAGLIAGMIPSERVVGCIVYASCLTDGPGIARHHFGNRIIIGEALGISSERVTKLNSEFRQAGFDSVASDKIQRDVWYKLWGNMTMNPISAFTGATTDRILNDPLVRKFVNDVMLEAKSIGHRLGVPIDENPEERHVITLGLGASKSSMLQDVEARKSVELDVMLNAVLELGRLTGVATPHTETLFGLARLHARTLGLYPTDQVL